MRITLGFIGLGKGGDTEAVGASDRAVQRKPLLMHVYSRLISVTVQEQFDCACN